MPSFFLSFFLSVFLSFFLSFFLSLYVSTSLFVSPFLSVRFSFLLRLCVCSSFLYLSICFLYICLISLKVSMFVYVFICPSVWMICLNFLYLARYYFSKYIFSYIPMFACCLLLPVNRRTRLDGQNNIFNILLGLMKMGLKVRGLWVSVLGFCQKLEVAIKQWWTHFLCLKKNCTCTFFCFWLEKC